MSTGKTLDRLTRTQDDSVSHLGLGKNMNGSRVVAGQADNTQPARPDAILRSTDDERTSAIQKRNGALRWL